MRLPRLTVAEALRLDGALFLDTRSPAEYAEDHLPGARSLPLFDDQERAIVGTLYHQRGPDAAWEQGLAFVQASVDKLVAAAAACAGRPLAAPTAELVDRLAASMRLDSQALPAEVNTQGGTRPGLSQAPQEPAPAAQPRRPQAPSDGSLCARKGKRAKPMLPHTPAVAPLARGSGEGPERLFVVYCWRGGMRSRTVALLLRALGLDCAQLAGGYKAYRHQVIADLAAWRYPPMLVLHGLTGVGKTLVIRRLAAACPDRVLDLEDLAGHRSSVLGPVGLQPASPRAFESRLLARMRRMDGERPWLVEWEGRKLGDIVLPARYCEAAAAGRQVELTAPVDIRARRLVDEYVTGGDVAALRRLLPFFERSLGREGLAELLTAFDAGQYEAVAACLLERHYDPRYRHALRKLRAPERIDATDLDRVVAELTALWAAVPAVAT